jgi:hypothetical protein
MTQDIPFIGLLISAIPAALYVGSYYLLDALFDKRGKMNATEKQAIQSLISVGLLTALCLYFCSTQGLSPASLGITLSFQNFPWRDIGQSLILTVILFVGPLYQQIFVIKSNNFSRLPDRFKDSPIIFLADIIFVLILPRLFFFFIIPS